MLGEVMESVVGRRFAEQPAVLAGYRRRLLRGAVYPAVVPAATESVSGVLWSGLDLAALAKLDLFEGALYERPALPVTLTSGERCDAFVYVLRPEHRSLATDALFEEADFRARHLRDYLAACRAFARESA
jgi:Gamma-glutamyl cyclotransferase, AIG2-like